MSYIPADPLTGDVLTQALVQSFETQYRETLKLASLLVLGGDAREFIKGSSYMSGAGADKLVYGSAMLRIDPSELPGSYALHVMMRVDNALAAGRVALFNLTDAPDVALTGSEILGTVGATLGEPLTSGTITFPAAGSVRNFGIKARTASASHAAAVWGARLVRTA